MDRLDKTIDILDGKVPSIPGHRHQKTDWWTMSAWKKDEVWFDDRHIIDEIEKLERELHNDILNDKKTVPRPIYLENKLTGSLAWTMILKEEVNSTWVTNFNAGHFDFSAGGLIFFIPFVGDATVFGEATSNYCVSS